VRVVPHETDPPKLLFLRRAELTRAIDATRSALNTKITRKKRDKQTESKNQKKEHEKKRKSGAEK
jgi:hypothetical protein